MPKTKIECRQTITTLIQMNKDGRNNLRIQELWQEYDKLVGDLAKKAKITRETVKHTDEEKEAIMYFQLDPRFTHTE